MFDYDDPQSTLAILHKSSMLRTLDWNCGLDMFLVLTMVFMMMRMRLKISEPKENDPQLDLDHPSDCSVRLKQRSDMPSTYKADRIPRPGIFRRRLCQWIL